MQANALVCRFCGVVGLVAALAVGVAVVAGAEAPRDLTEPDLAALKWRSIGPANMGGRVSAIALVPGSRTSFYVGFATGGIFFTDNLGVTFKPVFEHEATSSIGAIAVADAPEEWAGWAALEAENAVDPGERAERGKGLVVWVGTGEGNGRNSSSWGHGVYRSIDGGKRFVHLGLEETHDIPALAIDPRDPDTAYVAALGHLWGPNRERGLYKTVDGGRTWKRVLGDGGAAGACEVVLDPSRPDTVYAALYARRRTPWSFEGVSEAGGILRSDDGGKSWTKLGVGLPERTGRIGLTVFPADPKTLYAVVESDQGGIGDSAWDDRSPAGGLFRSDDRGESWRRVNQLSFRPFYFSRVAVDPADVDRVYMPGWDLAISDDGGRTFRRSGSKSVHVDQHAFVVNPVDPNQLLLGTDGGLYLSHDRGRSWDHVANLAVGQFYHVAVDASTPYRVAGGLQDNGSWLGPSRTWWRVRRKEPAVILSSDWRAVFGGDGFRVAFDPGDANALYATSQGGELARVDLATNEIERLRPAPDEGQERLRFNWDAPFLVSHHDPTVLYQAGNRVFKLTHRGRYWYPISPDLSRRQGERVMTVGSEAETYGTVTALAESPLRQGLLWAGTDDGAIHVTGDDGKSWREVTPPAVGGLYVASIEASAHDANTAYAAVDGHRSDVFRPIVLVTTDLGASWSEITGDLPNDSPVRVVHEDPDNPSVLYCGTETAARVSVDRGEHWLRLGGTSLPTVPVYDLVVEPRTHDLVAATHGRSLYILDDASPLAELSSEVLGKGLHLFAVRDAAPHLLADRAYGAGDRFFKAPNPQDGAVITYWLRELAAKPVTIRIEDEHGETVRRLEGPARPGLNRVVWDLRADPEHRFDGQPDAGPSQPRFVPPGTYTVVVETGELGDRRRLEVGAGPGFRDADEVAFIPPPTPWG